MVRTRGLFLAALAAVSFGSVLGACNKDKDADKKPADNKAVEADKTAPAKADDKPAAAPPPAPEAVQANNANPNASDLALLPAQSELVAGVNFKQLSNSALWKEFVAPKMASDENFQNGLGKVKTLCGFDPMASIESASVGVRGIPDSPEGAVVVHGLDKAKSMTCFDNDGKSDAEKDGTKVTIQDNVVLMQKDGKNAGFTFVNDTTLVVVFGADYSSVDAIKKVVGGDSGLQTSTKFVELYNKVNTGDSLWMLMRGDSKAISDAMAKSGTGMKFKAVYGSINITDGISADMRVRMDSPDQASAIAQLGNSQKAQAMMVVDKLDINADGPDVHATVTITPAKLKSLVQLAAMAGGSHGGTAKSGGLFGSH
jgi:hypothetical protein